MESLNGKVALVTGAAKRLGGAVALALARQGTSVVLHYRTSAGEVEATARAVRDLGVRAWTVRADLAVPEESESLLPRAVEAAAPIDLLVNNAAIFPAGDMRELTAEKLQANVNVNALAPFLIARRFAEQGRSGAIVNFLDARIAGHDPEHAAYHLSKRMLFTLTRMMAVEFAPQVRVNAVAPGLILPPAGKGEGYLEALASTNPLHRYGSAEDVAEAVVFLLRSDFVTGQVLFVDGGRRLRGSMYGC